MQRTNDELVQQLQRAVQEMQVSMSERDAEIIRLNLCLGDEKKRNTKVHNAYGMPLQISNGGGTP